MTIAETLNWALCKSKGVRAAHDSYIGLGSGGLELRASNGLLVYLPWNNPEPKAPK